MFDRDVLVYIVGSDRSSDGRGGFLAVSSLPPHTKPLARSLCLADASLSS